MTVHETSYLLRYVFTLLFALCTGLLLRLSLVQLRRDIGQRVRPVPGSRLMMEKTSADMLPDPSQSSVRVLQLWHTTVIGSAHTCDVRLPGESVSPRHVLLHLYRGRWYLRPATWKEPVLVNGVVVRRRIRLQTMDRLQIGPHTLAFLDDRQQPDGCNPESETETAFTTRPSHTGTDAARDTSSGSLASSALSGRFAAAWVGINLFALIAGTVMIFLAPGPPTTLRLWIGGYLLVFLLLWNMLMAVLPRLLPHADRVPLLCLMLLTLLGLLIQARLSLAGLPLSGDLPTPQALVRARQLLLTQAAAHGAGLLLMPPILLLTARTRLLEPLGIAGAIATPLLLLATLVLGRGADSHGATLWIDLGGFSFQLTEFAKITYLFVLAWFFKHRPSRPQLLLFAGWALLVLGLVMLLPDLGAALILVPTTLVVFVVTTSKYAFTFGLIGAGSGIAVAAYFLFPHVRRRLDGWTSLWTEVNDGNRQIVYGLQAIARGGLLGRGVGNGSPAGIPLASSDMIFALVCEELGLITGICLLGLFIALWLRAARVVLTGQDGFTASLALGIGTLFFMEAAIVIAGVTGLIPLTGATLPLIARGGSSVLAKNLMLALLVGLTARRESFDTAPPLPRARVQKRQKTASPAVVDKQEGAP